MKSRILSGSDLRGHSAVATPLNYVRLLVVCAMLALCALPAHAAAPVLILPSSVTTPEDTPTNITIGVLDTAEPIFTVTTVATCSDPGLVSGLSFTGYGTNRVLTITPGVHQSGTATITVVATDSQPSSTTNTFTLNVTLTTNYAPLFVATIGNQTNNENIGSTNLIFTVYDYQNGESNLTFTATSSNPTLIPNTNLVVTGTGTNRILTVTQATNENGVATIKLVVTDEAGLSATNIFLYDVWTINQAPTATMLTNLLTYNEDRGPVVISNFMTEVSAGPPNQAYETIDWSYLYTTNFFLEPPSIDANGTLTFEFLPNTSGTNTITFILTSSGSTTNGGQNALTNVLTLEVGTNFQQPTFSLATNVVLIHEESSAVTNVDFITSFDKGLALEKNAKFTYSITTVTNQSTNAAFKTLTLNTNGTLVVAPRPHSFGTNTVTIVMTVNGHFPGWINTATNTFQIAVEPTNHAPVIVGATNHTVLENSTNATATINVWDYDTQSTNLVLAAISSNTNLATVTVASTNVASATNALFTLNFTLATNSSGTAPITLIATEGTLSTTNTFNLVVSLVNQAPSFTLSTNLISVGEESPNVTFSNFVASVYKGPTNQNIETYKFAATTVTTNSTNASFQTLTVSPSGTLSVTPKAHSFGTNTVTLVMTLSGGISKTGVNSATNTFQIAVTQTNHAPVIVGAVNQTVVENATTGLTANINVWDYDKESTNLALIAISSNTSLATVAVTATNVVSATNAIFTITYTLAPNANGTVPIGLVASEGPLSSSAHFNLVIKPVDKAPNFILATNWVAVLEESGVYTYPGFVSGWNSNSSKIWDFTTLPALGGPNNASFSVVPSIDSTGTLTFAPTTHSFGTNQVQVIMTDTGNFFTNTFQIAVAEIIHAPVIAFTNLTVFENGQTTPNNTTNASVLVSDLDLVTNFAVTATSLNTNLTAVTVVTNAAGSNSVNYTLNFTLVTNASGTAPIQIIANETASQGSVSTTNTFTLTVTLVNQAPSYSFSTNYVTSDLATTALQVLEETSAVTNIGFLTNLLAGPPNEISQSWTFTTTTVTNNSTNVAFTTLPSIATNGTLTFSPAAHSFGTNLVTVVMQDNGGTNNGGVNAFTNTFLLEVAQIAHAPVIALTNLTVLENAGTTNAPILVWDYDQYSNFTFTATSANTNMLTVSFTTNSQGLSNALYTLTLNLTATSNGTATVQLTAAEGLLVTTNTFTLTVTPVNQAPSYNFSTNYIVTNLGMPTLQVLEETSPVTNGQFLTNLLAGPPNEIYQSWAFTTTTVTGNPTNVVFTTPPSFDTNGTLTFAPRAHSFGTNVVTVVMQDNGGTNNGGVDSYTNSFQIEVAQIAHAPAIALTNLTVLENAGTTNAPILVWDYDQYSNFTFTATSANTNMLTVSFTTNSQGLSNAIYGLTLNLTSTSNGTATVQLTAAEGSLATTNTFTLTVTPVNQAPSYNFSTNYIVTNLSMPTLQVNEETSSVTNIGFLTNLLAGPPNEINQSWTFATTTVTNNSTNASFTTLPSLDTNGTLTFAPAAHSFGTNQVTVVMQDNGGTNNGGVNAYTNTFLLEVAQIAHAPVIAYTNIAVLENASPTNVPILVWDYDQTTNFTFTATSGNLGLVTLTIASNAIGTSNVLYTLALTVTGDTNGTANIQLTAAEGSLATTNTFTLTVTPVEQPPSYTVTTNGITNSIVAVLENAGSITVSNFLTNLTAGPDQANQTYVFTTTVTTNATNVTFANLPAIDTNGTLTFTTATNSFGTNTVVVIMTDSTNTTNGGINFYSNEFQLQVAQVPYPPRIIGLTNQITTFEDQPTNSTLAFTVYDPLTNGFTVTSPSTNTGMLVVTNSGIANAYTLYFMPATNANGTNTVVVTVSDGTLNTTTNIVVIITPVNQPPFFNVAQSAITVDKYSVPVTISSAVTNIHAGPTNQYANDPGLTVGFVLSNSSPHLFVSQPAISSGGTLTFTPGTQGGVVTVYVQGTNNGGTANGGVNASAVQTLTITIPPNAFQYLAGPTFAGLFYNTNATVNASSGYFDLVLQTNGNFTGYLLCAGNSNTFSGQFDISNSYASVTNSPYVLDLTVDTSSAWTESITGSISNTTANWSATLTSYLAGYSTSFTTPLVGEYLMAMPGFSDPTMGPAGNSIFNLTISSNGNTTVTAYMADNTNATQTSVISLSDLYPLYMPLYSNGAAGSVIGWLDISGASTNSVTPDSTLTWFADTNGSAFYPVGFTNNALPLAALYSSTATNLLSFTNGTVILSGGNLVTPITNSVTITNNVITVNPAATNSLTLTINASTGEILGSFNAPGNITEDIYSVIIQNTTNVANGYFLGTSEGGSFTLFGP